MGEVGPPILPSDTIAELTEIVKAEHCSLGQSSGRPECCGGTILKWIDVCAAVSTHKFIRGCNLNLYTVAMDQVEMHEPAYLGDIIQVQGHAICAFTTSVVIQIQVARLDVVTGESSPIGEGKVTYVAIRDRRPAPVPKLETHSEQELAEAAGANALRAAKKTMSAQKSQFSDKQ